MGYVEAIFELENEISTGSEFTSFFEDICDILEDQLWDDLYNEYLNGPSW